MEQLYKKENNLFQSNEWLGFQASLGRKLIFFEKNNCQGILVNLPLNKKFIWIQKGPVKADLKELKMVAKKEGALFVRIEPKQKPASGKKVTKNSLLSGQKSPESTAVLDITKTEEELLTGMKPKTRYNIRLAEKKGVTVRASQEIADIDILFKLLHETAQKNKGFHHFPKSHYEKMFLELAPKGLLKLFIAEYEKEPLCAILISNFGEVTNYLHGGSSEKQKNLMAPYLCQWEAIKDAKANGAKIYDFWGIAATDDPKDDWAGITKFKKGFGVEQIDFVGAYDLPVNNIWYNFLTMLSVIRKGISRMIGR